MNSFLKKICYDVVYNNRVISPPQRTHQSVHAIETFFLCNYENTVTATIFASFLLFFYFCSQKLQCSSIQICVTEIKRVLLLKLYLSLLDKESQ